jgi:hypothetical protein
MEGHLDELLFVYFGKQDFDHFKMTSEILLANVSMFCVFQFFPVDSLTNFDLGKATLMLNHIV